MPDISDFDAKAAWTIAALDLAITPQELRPRGELDGLDLAGEPGDRAAIDPARGLSALEPERQRREGVLAQASASGDIARNAARDQLREDGEYVAAATGNLLQGELDELEKSSRQARTDAQQKIDPRGAVGDFDLAVQALNGKAASAESFTEKVKTARTDAVAAREKLKQEWDDKIADASRRGIEAARYDLDRSRPSERLVKNENAIAKERFALEAAQKNPAWNAQAKQADFDTVVASMAAPMTELVRLSKKTNDDTAGAEIAEIGARGISLDTYGEVSASLSAMPARRQYLDGVAAQATEAKAAGDSLAVVKALRTLAAELPPVKEFAAAFDALVNGEVARVQKASAPGQRKLLSDLVAAISSEAETDLEKAKARLPDLESLAKTVDVFDQKLAKVKNGDYKKAVVEGSIEQQKTLTDALGAVENIASDDERLSGAENLLAALTSEVGKVTTVVKTFTGLYDSAQGPIDKASETRRMPKSALMKEKERIRGLRTNGYDEATAALNAFVVKVKEVPAFLKIYDRQAETVLNLKTDADAVLKKQAEQKLTVATDCFTNLRFDQIDGALKALEQVLKLVDQKKKGLSKAGDVSKSASTELQNEIRQASDDLKKDPTQDKADALEKLLANVEAVTPLIKHAEAVHQQSLTLLPDPTDRQRLTGHLAEGVKAANARDFDRARSELGLAVPDGLLETRYKNEWQGIEATHQERAAEAKTYKLKEGNKLNALTQKAVTAAGAGKYDEAFDTLQELKPLFGQIERLAEEARYEADEEAFNVVYSPAWSAAHATFRSELTTWKAQATSLVGAGSAATYRAARAKLAELTVDLPTIVDYAKLTKTVYVDYDTRIVKSVPADIKRIKKLYDDASNNAISAPATGLTHLKALQTLLVEAAASYAKYTRTIATATSGIHTARATDSGTIDGGASPSAKLAEGKLSLADVAAMIPDTVPNTFTDTAALAGGFKYVFNAGGNRYRIHGHGPDTYAPAGSNSNSGGNVVRIRRTAANGTMAFLSSDGTWDASAAANHSDDTHIPLV